MTLGITAQQIDYSTTKIENSETTKIAEKSNAEPDFMAYFRSSDSKMNSSSPKLPEIYSKHQGHTLEELLEMQKSLDNNHTLLVAKLQQEYESDLVVLQEMLKV